MTEDSVCWSVASVVVKYQPGLHPGEVWVRLAVLYLTTEYGQLLALFCLLGRAVCALQDLLFLCLVFLQVCVLDLCKCKSLVNCSQQK